MKKFILVISMTVLLVVGPVQRSHAFWFVVTAAIKKALKAADLQVQRQQNKVIWLQNAQKTLENIMAKGNLDEITEWSKRQKEQYQKYYEELHKVKTVISFYYRIKEITAKETALIREYERATSLVRNDRHFTAQEIEYIGIVYSRIMQQTIKNVEDLSMVVQAFGTEMSDAKRLEIINATAEKVDRNYKDLIRFKNSNGRESLKRAQGEQDAALIRSIYGLPT
ncbi:hypothetical protein SAMN05216464_113112 [Mucilaginibacter pineti]|uniref:Conjugal transfer protein TraI n=1 Tax=Mucilaginibacter pineti TaxID=1391627 RepID=A0A1G7IPE4_9SPHI|nr:conjugal transfer protein TraI [Mucilaginibacter pineti]SDF14632.1 hypothetical protein SAMN05216464_113112 [Mucilaginibacter pineti]